METHVESGPPAPPEATARADAGPDADGPTPPGDAAGVGNAPPGARAEAPGSPGSPSPTARPPLVPEQLLVGLLTAVVMAAADGILAAFDETAPRVSAGELVAGVLHLVALYLPVGALLGLAVAGLVAVLRATPALDPLRERLAAPRRLIRNDPPAFAGGIGLVAAFAVVFFATHQIHELLATRVHRADLAAWAMAGLALAVLLAAALAGAAASAVVRPLARFLGPVASLATLTGLALIGGAVGASLFLGGRPEIAATYGWALLLWGPLAALVYLALAPLVRLGWRRRGPTGWRSWAIGGAAVGLALAAWVTSGLTYARSNRVRSVIEQRSVIGRALVRRYAGPQKGK